MLILMHLQLAQNFFRDVKLDGIAAAKLVCCQGWNHFYPAIMEHWLETRGFGSSLSLSIKNSLRIPIRTWIPKHGGSRPPSTPAGNFSATVAGHTSGYEFDFSDLLKSRFFPLNTWLLNFQEVCCHASYLKP